jgi:cytoskeletal protein CcmA (bactofilin family)
LIEGEVVSRTSINVLRDGKLKVSLVKTKRARINGSVEGKIVTSELLEVGATGVVQGEIVVKNIRTDEGSRMIGSMSTYQEAAANTSPKPAAKQKEAAPETPAPKTPASETPAPQTPMEENL